MTDVLHVLDLFSGIGGFSLGLERTGGFRTVAFCEIDPYCRRVLAKHWPDVPCYGDVRTLTADRLAADGIAVDVVCGGFPCQDISTAGKGAGIDGERSGLWRELARLIGELRPRYAVMENVSALLGRGLDRVLGDLSEIGYDAEWHCIPAAAVGAPHRRDRIWIVAYSAQLLRDGSDHHAGVRVGGQSLPQPQDGGGPSDVADARRSGPSGQGEFEQSVSPAPRCDWQAAWAVNGGLGDIWKAEPDVGRVADGVSARVDRLRALGNAVVPQIPELIGRAILQAERGQ